MKQEIKTEKGKKYLYLCVDANIRYGFISQSGKSFVFRVMGTYIKSNGEIAGEEGVMTGYIRKAIKLDFMEAKKRHYHRSDIMKHKFKNDGFWVTAIKIPIHNL